MFVVTGGAGFIGSHIIEELVKQGKDVVCVDNMVSGKESNILMEYGPSFFKPLDLAECSDGDLWNAFDGAEVIFHNAASKCTVCREDPKKDLLVNAWGSWRVFDIAQKVGAKVIHASTGSVYGENRQSEGAEYAPRSYYGVSKLAGEQYLRCFPELRWVGLRYFHVYGPRQDDAPDRGGVIPIFIRRMLRGKPITVYGDGEQVRSFTYVGDVVRANLKAAATERMNGQYYNVASGIKVTLNTLIDVLASILNVIPKVRYEHERPGDIKNFDVDNRKIAAASIGKWTLFRDGLRKTVEYYANS